jgi:type IV pilus assembly protein PilY1
MQLTTPIRMLAVMALALGLARSAQAQATGDDLFLVTTNLAPNVILIQDNSVSMNHMEWHWDFDPNATPDCSYWDNDTEYSVNGAGPLDPAAGSLTLDALATADSDCYRTRTIYDPANPLVTLYQGRYLNWLFSAASDPHVTEIDTAVHLPPPCNQPACGTCDQKYRRTRAQMGKQVLLDTLCIAEPLGIRFGQAFFRDPDNNPANDDPNGGYVAVQIDDPSPAHASDLEAHIKNLQSVSETPLGETLFQIYTYFMSRVVAEIPFGNDGITKFPAYAYKASTGQFTNQAQQIPDDPVEGICQKHFVVIVTDGAPDRDDFDADPIATAQGFGDFGACIGDYNADGEVEEPGDAVETAWYLDDIAKYMHEKDFRLDHDEDQTLDVYTIGLATDTSTDVFLQRVADVSDGLFFRAKDGDSLSQALVNALNDILKKSQSFTAATVPSSRTADGGDFYTSFFQPSGKRAFWDGHLRSWHITASGDIEDSLQNCALIDPDPGECNSGPFDPLAVPFWDAGSKVPLPPGRSLYVSKLVAGTPTRTSFDATLTAADLTIAPYTTPGAPPDPTPNNALYLFVGSTAEDEEELADEVVAYTRGCQYGTGAVTGGVAVPCVARPWRLGDIFHSNPVVVREPNGPSKDPSYALFKTNTTGRDRIIYAGANDGFLHAFHAGQWNGVTKTYNGGTGVEQFGFMPWQARKGIKNQAVDSPAARTYYVDGSPQQADVWEHPTPTSTTKNVSEWKTVLMGGMRQGGNQYYALDVTNPAAISYPGYLWEFPREDDTNNILDPNSFLPYLGETWGNPIITKIRLKVGADDNGGAGYERWVAVVTGGYAPSGDPNDKLNYDATATAGRSIYILDLKTGQVLAEKKFDPLALDEQANMLFAMPATPSVFDSDADGFADLIYVGDLGGNIWKWVIKDIGDDRVNDLSGLRTQPNWAFRRVFNAARAKIGGGLWRYKSFFTQIAGTLSGGDIWLVVGSGERADLPYPGEAGNPDENNRLYVVIDKDAFELQWAQPYVTPVAPALPMVTEADLDDLSGTAACSSITGPGYSFVVGDGEKFVTRSNIFAGLAIAATFTPLSNAANVCGAKGDGILYIFDLLCGKGWFDDGSGNPTRGLDIGLGFPTDPQVSTGVGGADNRIYIEKSSSSDEGGGSELFSLGAPDLGKENAGLIYWRELP